METQNNIRYLCGILKSRGWLVSESKNAITVTNTFLFTESISVDFFLDSKSRKFSVLLKTSLFMLLQIDSSLESLPVISVLLVQAKNIQNKFSKKKVDWVLSEPNSKYQTIEIPDIYIPRNSIFAVE